MTTAFVRRRRRDLCLSVRELAALAGCTPAYLYRLERLDLEARLPRKRACALDELLARLERQAFDCVFDATNETPREIHARLIAEARRFDRWRREQARVRRMKVIQRNQL